MKVHGSENTRWEEQTNKKSWTGFKWVDKWADGPLRGRAVWLGYIAFALSSAACSDDGSENYFASLDSSVDGSVKGPEAGEDGAQGGFDASDSGGSQFIADGSGGDANTTVEDSQTRARYKVTFDPNGGLLAGGKLAYATEGRAVSNPSAPTRNGYIFVDWYTEASEANQNETTRFKFAGELSPDAGGNGQTIVTSDITLYARWVPATLEGVVKLGKLPADLSPFDEVTRNVLSPYKTDGTAPQVSAIFVTVNGGSQTNNLDGKSWEKAWSRAQLKEKLDGINDASENKIYLFLVAAGEYKVDAGFSPTADRYGWLSMKDNVAIVGGWDGTGGGGAWTRKPSDPAFTTNFKGNRVVGAATRKPLSVFHNQNLTNKSVLGYATISDGDATDDVGGGGMYNDNSSVLLFGVTFTNNYSSSVGGAMFNGISSSPTLNNVIIIGNSAASNGGGVYNLGASPLFAGVTFANNRAHDGGGIFNDLLSAPIFVNATFTGNEATNGGGMVNLSAAPTLVNVTFTGNSAILGRGDSDGGAGGAMLSQNSIPSLVNVTMVNNTASTLSGGMVNDGNGGNHMVVNCIFWGNTLNSGGVTSVGPQIYLFNTKETDPAQSAAENVSLYNSIIGGGVGAPTSSASGTLGLTSNFQTRFGGITISEGNSNQGDSVSIVYENVYGADNTAHNPKLLPLANHGGTVQTMALDAGSFAINKGLYVTGVIANTLSLYSSEDNIHWFIHDAPTKQSATLPVSALDLTKTDARSFNRVNKPDLGAYEYGASPFLQ